MANVLGSGSTVTVGAGATTEVLEPRYGRRVEFTIANSGANAAFIVCSNVDTASAANKGVYLPPGSIASSNERLPEQDRVTCWSTAGTTLAVFERVIL